MAQILQNCPVRKMIYLLDCKKENKKGFVEGTKAEKLTILRSGRIKKQTGKGKLKMTKANQNSHANKRNIDYKFKIRKPAQITS